LTKTEVAFPYQTVKDIELPLPGSFDEKIVLVRMYQGSIEGVDVFETLADARNFLVLTETFRDACEEWSHVFTPTGKIEDDCRVMGDLIDGEMTHNQWEIHDCTVHYHSKESDGNVADNQDD
jgi:hypothetical protein